MQHIFGDFCIEKVAIAGDQEAELRSWTLYDKSLECNIENAER